MIDNTNIIPNKYIHGIIQDHVGISFAIKKNVSDKIKFINSDREDYLYLKEAEYRLYNIIISPYVAYFVRMSPYNCDILDRKYINLLENINYIKIKQEESTQDKLKQVDTDYGKLKKEEFIQDKLKQEELSTD